MKPEHIQSLRAAARSAENVAEVPRALADILGPARSIDGEGRGLGEAIGLGMAGSPQLVTQTGGSPVVLISIDDLTVLLLAMSKAQSFKEALDDAGFVPATGVRIAERVVRNFERKDLKRLPSE